MACQMTESNAYCTFCFHRHLIQKQNSRKRQHEDAFKAGLCIFDSCTCKFELTMKKTDFEGKLVTVTYNGLGFHATSERHSRSIKGNERN